jgi:hypothetical protein
MERLKTHDPLLGSPLKPTDGQNGRPGNTNGQKTAAATGDMAATNPQPSSEMIRDAYATNLRDMTGAAHLYVAVAHSLSGSVSTDAFKVYRDRLIRDAGNPTDPIEIMLIEQLAMAHFHVGRLYLKSCSVDAHKLATAYADAATRLLGEFRRCTLALEDFRAKQAARKERAACIDVADKATPVGSNGKPRQPSRNGKKKAVDSELRTNGRCQNAFDNGWGTQPAASRSKPSQSAETERLDRGRPREAAAICPEASAVAVLNRAAHARGEGQGRTEWQESPEGSGIGARTPNRTVRYPCPARRNGCKQACGCR